MAAENYGPAWSTKLANAPAKQVLVLLANEAGVSGMGCLRMKLMAERAELSLRTVRRILQVFERLELMKRREVTDHWGRVVAGFQLNMQMLGSNLEREFEEAYKAISGKAVVSETADEEEETVSETAETVSETAETVSETAPPHPLIGSSVYVPFLSPLPAGGEDGEPDAELDVEQLRHLEQCKPEDRAMWERYYREDNQRQRESIEREAYAHRKAAQVEEQLREQMPTLAHAVRWLFATCRFVRKKGPDELAAAVEEAIRQDAVSGEYWRSARKMASAFVEYGRAAPRLRWRYGPEKFITTGTWLDQAAWPWK